FIPKRMSPRSRKRRCCTSTRSSVSTVELACRCVRYRRSSRSMICQRSGRISPSATPSTTGGSVPQIDERAQACASGLRLLLFSTRQSVLSSEPPESLAVFQEHQRLKMAERQLLGAPFHLPTCQLQSELNLLRKIGAV